MGTQSTCKEQSDRTCVLGLAVTSVFVFLAQLCATKHELNNYAVSNAVLHEPVAEDIPLVWGAGQQAY